MYKLRILGEYEQLDKAGKGALRRREGLYTSLISEWRKQRDKGALQALPQRRGRPPTDPLARKNARRERENARLRDQLARQAKVIQVRGGTLCAGWQARDAQRRPDRGGPGGQRAEQLLAALEEAVTTLAPMVGTVRAGRAVGLPRSGWCRRHRQSPPPPAGSRRPGPGTAAAGAVGRRAPAGAGGAARRAVLDTAPAGVSATLLDEGRSLCSPSTMDRLLGQQGETGDRRRHATLPATVKPELLATTPNRCWSWDITKLAGPARWTWFYLQVILDIDSRSVVGWMVAAREAATLAERLLAETVTAQQVEADKLTVYADRSVSMASKPVALLLADLGVTRSHSRPHVSNDNPYSESQFKTSSTTRPSPSGSAACRTPARAASAASAGTASSIATAGSRSSPRRTDTMAAPRRSPAPAPWCWRRLRRPPERFVGKPPQPPRLPEAVWINKPIDPAEPPQQFPG